MIIHLIAVFVLVACELSAMRAVGQEHVHGSEQHQSTQDGTVGPVDHGVAVVVPTQRREHIGLKLARIERREIAHAIRTVGIVAVDERREAHVHTRFTGWIEDIRVSYVGALVKKGDPLCFFYSPELLIIQQEYLSGRGRGSLGGEVARAALDRLRLMGVPAEETEQLVGGQRAKLRIRIDAPIDGYVVSKMAVQGMYVTPDMLLYHIADLSKVWVLTTLYESDLPFVRVGDQGTINLAYDPQAEFRGPITYIYPEVNLETRTVRARLEVDNPNLSLKPGMYTTVALSASSGAVLALPEDAVIDTGKRKVVFTQAAPGQFEARTVRLGRKGQGFYEVVDGLKEGEAVAIGAQFLLDSESRLRSADAPAHAGH